MELMLEVTPPSRRASKRLMMQSVKRIADAVNRTGNVNYINIPEIVDENFRGMPLYRHYDTREFGLRVEKVIGRQIVINKITVHMKSRGELLSWVRESVKHYGLNRFVFVGGSVEGREYRGPTVTESNRIASKINGVKIGNICIPTRKNEPSRMLSKTESGASFFTTQVLLDSKPIKRVLKDYRALCSKKGIVPATVFLSFAAVSTPFDLEFIEWLGAEIPDKTETYLLRDSDLGPRIGRLYASILSDIKGFVSKNDVNVPLGLNIESISATNLEGACRTAEALTE